MQFHSTIENDSKVNYANHLKSNDNFVNLVEKKKSESENSDFDSKFLDPWRESARNGENCNTILSDCQNLYKHNGMSMENLGYFIIPRSVTSDPRYKGARLKYKHVLHILFENVAFSPTTHAVGTEIININIGQFCVTIRGLAEICNQGVKHEEDKIDRNTIHRAIRFFEKCQFVRQEVRQGKTLLTITVQEFYDRLKKRSETTTETKARQDRDIKEEDKELKEYNNNISASLDPEIPKKPKKEETPYVASSLATQLLDEFFSSLLSSIPDFPKEKLRKTKSQLQAADRLLKTHTIDALRAIIQYAHRPGDFWIKYVHSLTYLEKKIVTLKEQIKNPVNRSIPAPERPQPKYQQDTRPRNPRKSFDFSGEI